MEAEGYVKELQAEEGTLVSLEGFPMSPSSRKSVMHNKDVWHEEQSVFRSRKSCSARHLL